MTWERSSAAEPRDNRVGGELTFKRALDLRGRANELRLPVFDSFAMLRDALVRILSLPALSKF